MSSMSKSSDSNKRLVPRFDRGSADPFRHLTSLNDASDRSLQLLFFALLDVLCSHLTDNDPIKSHRLFQYEIQLLQISKILPSAMSLTAQSIRQSSWFHKYVRTLRDSLQAALRLVERAPMETSDSTNISTLCENDYKQVVLATTAPTPNLSIEIPQPDIQLKVPIPLNLNGTMMISDFDNFVLFRYVQDFAELGRVGKGAFGSVFCAQNRLDSCKYAIKKIVFNENNDRARRQAKHTLREVRILASLHHTNIVQYHCAWLELVPVSPHRTHRTSSSSSTSDVSGKVNQRTTAVKPMDSLDEMIQFKENSDPQPIIEEHDSQQKSSSTSTSPDDDEEDENEISASEFTGKDSNVERYHSDGAAMMNDSKASYFSNGSDEKQSNKQLIPLHSRQENFPPVPRSNYIKAHIVLFIQMQLCETTLHDWLRFRDRRAMADLDRSLNEFSQRQCWQIFKQLLTAVEYLHSQSFVHRDIKPRNIFLDIDPNDKTTIQVKLGDFGLATLLDSKLTPESPSEWKTDESTGVGTALYAPPEQLNSAGCTVTEKSDTYSLGIVLFELFSVFLTEQERILSLDNLRVRRTVEKTFADLYPFEAMLIEELIRFEPNARPSVKTILTTYAKEIQQRMKKFPTTSKQTMIEQLQEALRDRDRRIEQLETELERKIS